jgi:DNA polymerase III delta' subunit
VPAWLTRGQPSALAVVVRAVVSGMPPQSLLLAGPAGVGKTTVAIDLACGLLCLGSDPAARPCGACSACRKVAHGNHPDLIRLAPEGAGRQIRIGDRENPDPGTIRHLVRELARLPSEGRVRIAVVEEADRMNLDAQNALLKVLEEPSAAACVILCVSDEDALLPTVRSRCVRIRLGAVSADEIADLLIERALADAPRAAALARLADGSPGRAIGLSRSPEAVLLHERLVRELLDLLQADRRSRLTSAATLVAVASEFNAALQRAELGVAEGESDGRNRGAAPAGTARGRQRDGARMPDGGVIEGEEAATDGTDRKSSPAARRSGVLTVIAAWRTLARDLAVAGRGGRAEIRLIGLLEEIVAASRLVEGHGIERFLARLDMSAGQLERNANPELLLDVLLLAWPRVQAPAGARPMAPRAAGGAGPKQPAMGDAGLFAGGVGTT